MTVTADRDEINRALIARTAPKDIFLPEFPEGVFSQPFGKIILIEPAECRLAVHTVNDDDVLWCEFVQE